MKLAVNYSAALTDLVERGHVAIDLYKAPAWPDLVRRLASPGAAHNPTYVHFPILAGTGRGHPISTETGGLPDWTTIDELLAQTKTPWVSAHLGPRPEDHPDLAERPKAEQVRIVIEALSRDLGMLVDRFGADRVVGENIFEFFGMHLRPAVLPEVLSTVVSEVDCGFLLDLSHARLAARDLGVDAKAYVEALPVRHLREIHITGIQVLGPRWTERMRAAGVDSGTIDRLAGHWIDHLPMTPADWDYFDWALERIQSGSWRTPEIVAFEYGGIGPEFEALTIPEVLADQVPMMYERVHAAHAR
jgi:uncharacterized protein (UPF0276 family)